MEVGSLDFGTRRNTALRSLRSSRRHARSRQFNCLSFAQAQVLASSFFDRRAKELAGDIEPGNDSFSVANSMQRYLESYRRRGGKALDKMESEARTYILPDLDALALAKLSKGRIEKWHEGIATSPPRVRSAKEKASRLRAAGTGPEFSRKRRATANRALTVLKSALNNAYHDGLATHDDTWRRVKAYRNVDAARVQYLTDQEANRLANACEPDFRDLVIGALMTGCRYGELIALTANDFDVTGGTICIRQSKSGKPRYVALSEDGVDLFRKMTHGVAALTIFSSKRTCAAWKRSEQQRPFLAACEIAQLSNIRSHGLRHTYASRLVMKGAPLAVVAAQLGHSDTRMVEKHYGHLAPNYVRDTIRSLYSPMGLASSNNVVTFSKASV